LESLHVQRSNTRGATIQYQLDSCINLQKQNPILTWKMKLRLYCHNFLLFPYCCVGWATLWYLHRFFSVSNISYLNSPPLSFSLIPTSWNGFNRYHFLFTNMHTHYLYHIHPLTPFSIASPSQWFQPSLLSMICSTLLFSNFVEEKRQKIKRKTWTFSMFEVKVATQGVLVIFPCIYVL
jgi:hypothetical protein